MDADRATLWMTLGCGLVAASAGAGVPIGLAVNTRDAMILVAAVSFAVFLLGIYVSLASFGGLPLPNLGKRRRKAEEKGRRKVAAAKEKEQQQRRARQESEDEKRRKAQMGAIAADANRSTEVEREE